MNKENLKKIIELRHELHKYPELAMNESHTKRRLMNFIEANTNLAVVDCGKWFYASRYVEGTSAIAFRADMDALPMNESITLPYASVNEGVSHKCGHDGHCAALCGLALELANINVNRSVYLIFQHAEETGQGGSECSAMIRERNISEIYAFHNWSGYPENSIVIRSGLCHCASQGLTIKFTGITSHASEPEKGINPSFAVGRFIMSLKELHEKYEGRKILCTVVNVRVGEKNFGISPGDGEVSLTLRAEHENDMKSFDDDTRKLAVKTAEVHNVNVSFETHDYFPETVSDSECVMKVKNAAEKLGLDVIAMNNAIRASEDFGWYMKQIPGAIFYVGNGEDYPAIHTGIYDFNDNILTTAVDMFRCIFMMNA
ncbi:MAG: amidohydrolase [Synergistaceae bacterium]|nr:amidohydrolase [Synergistaceae bacterium]